MAGAEPSWELYRSFLGVIQEGSLSGAARALGLAQPTVGRHIDDLERALGFALFTRSQQGFRPTEAALALRPYAETLAATAATLLRVASSQGAGVRGTVRVSASEMIGVEVLPAILVGLRQQHPELVIELTATNRVEDLLQREADIAVRMVRPSQGALIAKRIGDIELGLHAHRTYLERHGTPTSWEELASHTLIGFDQETPFLRRLGKLLGPLQRQAFALRSDSDLAQYGAIRSGFGIGVCQVGLAKRDGLVRLLPELLALQLETWITMHEDLRDTSRCRVTYEALVAGLTRYIGG